MFLGALSTTYRTNIYLFSFFCVLHYGSFFNLSYTCLCVDRLAVGQNWDTTSFSVNSNHRAAVDIHEVYQAFINMP